MKFLDDLLTNFKNLLDSVSESLVGLANQVKEGISGMATGIMKGVANMFNSLANIFSPKEESSKPANAPKPAPSTNLEKEDGAEAKVKGAKKKAGNTDWFNSHSPAARNI